jgi:protein phosphatase
LQTGLSEIVKEALEVSFDEFLRPIEEAAEVLSKENERVGNLNIMGKLVKTNPSGQALVIGDLHGDLESLIQILQESRILARMSEDSNTVLVFLGDYGDRGEFSAEIYYTVCRLKLLFKKQIVLMRGNHEGPKNLLPSPHDLPTQMHLRFHEKGKEAYARTRRLFEQLYTALIVEGRCIMIHGGPPHAAQRIEDLAYAHMLHPNESFLEEMLWNDPVEEIEDVSPSPRGAGVLFGRNLTDRILRVFNVKILIRGHEPCEEGFKINHNGRILTLFSRKGPPYFNTHAAYLDLKLSESFEKAEQLIPYIHKF